MEEKKNLVYHHTYFRIEAGYKWGEGMSNAAFDAFISEIILLFAKAKWTVAPVSVGDCVDVIKGKTKLYVHPMEVSGPCEDSLVPEVEAILARGTTFSHYRTDKYDQLLDLEGAELSAAYHTKDEETEKILLRHYVVPRKKGNVRTDLFYLADKIRIKTLNDYIGRCTDDPAHAYMMEMYESLVEAGKIVSDGNCVRAAREDEKRVGLFSEEYAV